jgi:hypothetical protein
LCFGSEDVFDDPEQAAAIMGVDWYLEDALRCWVGPSSPGQQLTSLVLAAGHCYMLEVWPVPGHLTQLHSLCVLGVSPGQLPGMLELQYHCRHLTQLRVTLHSTRHNAAEDVFVQIISEVSHEQCVRVGEAV